MVDKSVDGQIGLKSVRQEVTNSLRGYKAGVEKCVDLQVYVGRLSQRG